MLAPASSLRAVKTGDAVFVSSAASAPESHQTGTEAQGGATPEHGAFPPFDTRSYVSQLVWLAIAFGLLYFLMSRVALPRVGGILKHRAERIALDIKTAKEAHARAAEAEQKQNKALADARAQAQAMAQETHAKLAASAEQERKALDEQLYAKIAASETQIEQLRLKAMENVSSIASDAAAAIIQKIAGATADPSKIAAAVASAAK